MSYAEDLYLLRDRIHQLESSLSGQTRNTLAFKSERDEFEARIARALEDIDAGPECDPLDGRKGLLRGYEKLVEGLRAILTGESEKS